MCTQEQVTKLQSKLDSLSRVKNKLEALQSMTWLKIDFGYKDSACRDLSIMASTVRKIQELLIAEYASHVRALQDEVENTIIINPSKL